MREEFSFLPMKKLSRQSYLLNLDKCAIKLCTETGISAQEIRQIIEMIDGQPNHAFPRICLQRNKQRKLVNIGRI